MMGPMSNRLELDLDLPASGAPEPEVTVIDDDYDDWDLPSVDSDAIHQAVHELLEAGPSTNAVLVAALIDQGLLPLDADPDDAADLVDQLLLDMPGIWQHDGSVARITDLLEGRVFTHRLTALDLRSGGLEAEPDLVAVGCGPDTKTLADGTGLIDTDDHDSGWFGYVGPAGWLEGRREGDLVAARFSGGRWTLEPGTEPGDGSAEANMLLAELAPAIEAGRGDELLCPVLNALSTDADLFRHPTPPISEMLTAAGLLRDGVFFGPSDRIWYPHAGATEVVTRRVAGRHDIGGCCLTALHRSATRWRAHVLDLTQVTSVPSAAETAVALEHEAVPGALAELMQVPRYSERASTFVDDLRRVAPDSAGPLALAGAVADRLARHDEAEELYRQALAMEPSMLTPVTGLAWQAFDRGDIATASQLLRRVLETGHRQLRLVDDLAQALPRPGRNSPCPCGSGRKYKACHLGQPIVSADARPQLLLTKLARFAGSNDMVDTFGLRAKAAGLSGDAATKRLAFEISLFGSDTLVAYRRVRGGLLPAEELSLIDRIIETPIRIVEVEDWQGDGRATFHDLVTGDSIPCRHYATQPPLAPGEVGLARIIDGQLVGSFIPVVRAENQLVIRSLLAGDHPPAPNRMQLLLLSALEP